MALASGITKKTTTYQADPRTIGRRVGWNPRIDFGDIAELAKSIKANGLLRPLRVKRPEAAYNTTDAFLLIDGDRRLTAIELILEEDANAFPEGVPIELVDKEQDSITSLIQMFEENTGKPFTPVEEAEAYKRMRDAGLKVKDIAACVSRCENHIIDTLNLVDAPAELKQAVISKKVGGTTAKEIARVAKGNTDLAKDLLATAEKAKAGDKDSKTRLRVAINKAADAKAAAKGKEVRQRTAIRSAEAIQKQCERLVKHWEASKSAEGFTDKDLAGYVEAVADDSDLAAAFVAGAIEALKYVMGRDANLEI